MKQKFQDITKAGITYLKSLNWIVLMGLAVFCIVLAIVNNIRLDGEKSVEWIGTQDVMEKPADVL